MNSDKWTRRSVFRVTAIILNRDRVRGSKDMSGLQETTRCTTCALGLRVSHFKTNRFVTGIFPILQLHFFVSLGLGLVTALVNTNYVVLLVYFIEKSGVEGICRRLVLKIYLHLNCN